MKYTIRNSVHRCMIALMLLIVITSCQSQEENANDQLQSVTVPTGENASLPYLITGEDGNLYFSWVEKKDSNWVELKYSMLEVDKWTEPQLIAKGNDWFVNWADYPMLAVDADGNMMAHYLAKSAAGTYSYDVNIVMKKAGDDRWSKSMIPHDDGTPTEHGFVTMLPQNDGTFQVSWLDGRNTGGGDHDDHGGEGAMTIRTARLDMDGGLSAQTELDGRVCDCCQTTGANTNSGPVVIYRDRSALEIRDLSIVRNVNQQWSAPTTIYKDDWNIAGCPVNGPRAAYLGNTLTVAWYAAAKNQPEVKIAFSTNNGETFQKPIIIDQSSPLGRVDVALVDSQKAIVSWLTSEEGKTKIKARFVEANGSLSAPFDIAKTSESRGSGFPQLETHNGSAYFCLDKFWGREANGGEIGENGNELLAQQLLVCWNDLSFPEPQTICQILLIKGAKCNLIKRMFILSETKNRSYENYCFWLCYIIFFSL